MFAVVDVETTGLFAGGHDRVVEIGVVLAEADGAVSHQWSSLVDPGRDLGPTEIHGISQALLTEADAPRFDQIAGDILTLLEGQVLVAHNARFDLGFLQAEFARSGISLGATQGLCTLQLAAAVGLAGGRSLAASCTELGIELSDAHEALADALATAELLERLLARATVSGMGVRRPHPIVFDGTRMEPSGLGRVRPKNLTFAAAGAGWLSSVAQQLPLKTAPIETNPGAALAYADLLDRALEDRRLDEDEVMGLADLAAEWSLSRSDIDEIHKSYLTALVALALADNIITDAERRDLERVAALLGCAPDSIDTLTAAALPAVTPNRRAELRGQSVCFTGKLTATVNGEPLSRTAAESLAARAGLSTSTGVTKKLDLLVCADPDSNSGKAKKARGYGVRIMSERAFWKALEVAVD